MVGVFLTHTYSEAIDFVLPDSPDNVSISCFHSDHPFFFPFLPSWPAGVFVLYGIFVLSIFSAGS